NCYTFQSCNHAHATLLTYFILPSLIGHPPRAPLVPYTPLFRSMADQSLQRSLRALGRAFTRRILATFSMEPPSTRKGDLHATQKDRKSTRLNSSHVKISYAVFCWKKKN